MHTSSIVSEPPLRRSKVSIMSILHCSFPVMDLCFWFGILSNFLFRHAHTNIVPSSLQCGGPHSKFRPICGQENSLNIHLGKCKAWEFILSADYFTHVRINIWLLILYIDQIGWRIRWILWLIIMSFLLFHCVAGQQFIFIYYNSLFLPLYASVFSISPPSKKWFWA